ncbi:MAG: carbohydrate binding domain-containing protein [Armatimonadota bacterium]
MSTNLLVDANVENVQKIMQQAKKSGYNSILLNDVKFSRLGEMDQRYFLNAEKIKKTAKELGLDIIPAVSPVGYSEGILAHDPNLTEGIPVKDALFEVKSGQADLVPDPKANLVNGDFEQADGDKFINWSYQDNIGKSTFSDKDVHHSGKQSIRMENIGTVDPQNGLSRIWQSVQVQPNKQYHLSVWIKTENFESTGGLNILTLGSDGHTLSFPALSVNNTQDWTQYHVVFNSLGSKQVAVYFGVWGGKDGKIWWDDAQLEEVGLLNLVRRDGCPFVVKSEDGKIYEEGRDFKRVVDEQMGNNPWPGSYDIYHKPPIIHLTPDSQIKDGQKLLVSFFHSVSIYGYQVTCCLTHPKVYTVMEDEIRRINDLFHPKGFMMSYDEIRVANWCDLCQARKATPGKLLADNTKRCIQIINKINPKAQLYIWSDMYDPNHNAVDNYYLVNGTWAGSWEGLTPKVTILNWNSTDKRKQSMAFFAKRGHSQILAGYYDGPPDSIRSWLDDGKGIKGIDGVMYTTWIGRYDDIDAFAKSAWVDTKPKK